MKNYESLSHTRYDCKYHVVFIPKYRAGDSGETSGGAFSERVWCRPERRAPRER